MHINGYSGMIILNMQSAIHVNEWMENVVLFSCFIYIEKLSNLIK